MEIVVNNYLPGDQRLVDKIVYELKAQGIFDQFRKECFADVDTKPAYQNLRQRVENNVTGFLKEQSWRPDMNKNQVREMLRKRITESGYLEKGVERIVDQVVNPKINSVFLPKVEEVIYKYLGIEKPNSDNKTSNNSSTNNNNNSSNNDDKNDNKPIVKTDDLLPQDLEAVSPESEPIDKKDEKINSNDNTQDLDDNKMEEDESPPFEPLEEQSVYNPHEENSIDSHMSGFSGLISHESNVSSDNKPIIIDLNQQDSQMSRNSSESHLSIVTSDDNNSKMDICLDDSQSKSFKSTDSNSKIDKIDKTKQKHDNIRKDDKDDRDRERKSSTSSKDSKSRHSTSHSSRDKDRNRDHKSSSSSSKNDKDRSRDKDKKSSSSSSSKHNSKDKDRNRKESSSRDRDRDRNRSSSSHYDKDTKKSNDSTKKSKKDDKSQSHSSSSSSDRYKKDKDKDRRKESKTKDDHYSSRDRKNDRRSNDRDSNGSNASANNNNNNNNKQSSNDSSTQSNNDFKNNSGDSNNNNSGGGGNSEQKDEVEGTKLKLLKPKFASNIKEAMKLMKIRKQLAKLEKQNQLSLTSVDVNKTTLLTSSICLNDIKTNNSFIISQDNWDRMEAKLNQQIVNDNNNNCKYFDDINDNKKNDEFLQFINDEINKFNKIDMKKRKFNHINNNNNNNNQSDYYVKRPKLDKKNHNSSHIIQQTVESFPLPLSPAESDNSLDRKEATPPLKPKRNNLNKSNNQRYSSDDLYKPRPTFINSRRRGTRLLDN